MLPRTVLFLAAVVCCCASLSVLASDSSLPPHLSQTFNPLGKKHAVSRSSFHTSKGIVRDVSRAYEGQGTSHVDNMFKQHQYPLDAGVHLWDETVYTQVMSLAKQTFGTVASLPSIENAAKGAPEQVKISITRRQGEMVVNWLTWNATENSVVRFGSDPGNYTNSASGSSFAFVDPNTLHIIRYLHNVVLTDLESMTTNYYIVGDPSTNVWSDELQFTTLSDGSDVVTLAIYGDMGVVNSVSMQTLSEEVATGTVNAVLHVGDYAYNMDEVQGLTGDIFLEEMQNITSRVPYMGCPGNHEAAFNFSHFANKFSNFNFIVDPVGKPDQNWFYSWDMASGGANIHFISVDTELYYWAYASKQARERNLTLEQIQNYQQMVIDQYNFIVKDLTAAYDSGIYDWIIAYGHRPMYCSNVDDIPDCSSDAELLRLGPNGTYGLEAALSTRPVDLYFTAHEHSYERTLPVKNGIIDQQANVNQYVNPLYTTHIVTGAGGCREYYDYYDAVFYGPWSAFRDSAYGYGKLTVLNSTHLFWEQLLDEGRGGTDPLWIIKNAKEKKETDAQMPEDAFPSAAAEGEQEVIESMSIQQQEETNNESAQLPVEVPIAIAVATPAATITSTTLLGSHQLQQVATE